MATVELQVSGDAHWPQKAFPQHKIIAKKKKDKYIFMNTSKTLKWLPLSRFDPQCSSKPEVSAPSVTHQVIRDMCVYVF